jgi:putative methyltransferase (TIGR04325 family)
MHVPVILFAYARPNHLERVLDCLRENHVPEIYAFSDGAKNAGDAGRVHQVRELLRSIDWCKLHLVERSGNFGLGKNVLAGVSQVAASHEAFVVWEDDLICVPGTYAWVCEALRHYADDSTVMSVSAWTHERITPSDIGNDPYLDGRADCWVWGSYAWAWRGIMEGSAEQKMIRIKQRGIPVDDYGTDLPGMARMERRKNIWAVRWLYHHLEHGALCVRPPWSMVEHIGFDTTATNAAQAKQWENPPLREAPDIPPHWPRAVEHPECRNLWQLANPPVNVRQRVARWVTALSSRGKSAYRALCPEKLRHQMRAFFGWKWFRGRYSSWQEATVQASGYDDDLIFARVAAVTRAARARKAAWDRDGVLFAEPKVHAPLLAVLQGIVDASASQRLEVLDFGGALGSTWWQHRRALEVNELRWTVVEQSGLVEVGRREFTTDELSFSSSLIEVVTTGRPDVVLLSGVLPYLEKPHVLLAEVVSLGFEHVILDRTPFIHGRSDRLVVQHTPPALGGSSYPCWLFAEDSLLTHFKLDYDLVTRWEVEFDRVDRNVNYRGFHFRRKAV